MSNSLTNLVPVLDGTNYQNWSPLMEAFLGFQNLLPVTNGTWSRPTGTDDNEGKEKWDSANQQARGAIILRLNASIQSLVISKTTAKQIWDHLKATYGKPGLATIYSDFKQLAQFRISGGDPRPEIALFRQLLDRLTAN